MKYKLTSNIIDNIACYYIKPKHENILPLFYSILQTVKSDILIEFFNPFILTLNIYIWVGVIAN